MIYIAEAHASDEWPIGNLYADYPVTPQTKTLEQRRSIALEFIAEYNIDVDAWPLFLDDPGANTFEAAYRPWPLGVYMLNQGKVEHVVPRPQGLLELGPLRRILSGEADGVLG